MNDVQPSFYSVSMDQVALNWGLTLLFGSFVFALPFRAMGWLVENGSDYVLFTFIAFIIGGIFSIPFWIGLMVTIHLLNRRQWSFSKYRIVMNGAYFLLSGIYFVLLMEVMRDMDEILIHAAVTYTFTGYVVWNVALLRSQPDNVFSK